MEQKGLTTEQASKRFEKYGPNKLRELPKPPAWQKFLEQFKDVMILLLLVAIVFSAFLGELLDAAAIAFIVLFNAVFGYLQERKAEQSLEALKKMVSPQATVIRDGEVQDIEAHLVVPGDLLVLEPGDAVPADAKLVESMNLKVDESALTGESVPVLKKEDEEVFMGTIVTHGKAYASVHSTGMNTRFGNVAKLVQTVERENTPLSYQLEDMGKQLTLVVIAISILVFLMNWRLGLSFIDSFLIAVALAVAAVPEGLPAIVTISLALGMQKMAQKYAIVRKLKAVETLGSTTVICSDKTGTLTRNEMMVRKLFVNGKMYNISGAGYEPKGEFTLDDKKIKPMENDDLETAMRISLLCNSAHLHREEGRFSIIGDPTEGALVVLANKGGMDREDELKRYKPVSELTFDSERKRMTTIHKHMGSLIALTKGAPTSVLRLCKKRLKNGKEVAFSKEERKRIEAVNDDLAQDAFRVLALAYRKLPKNTKLEIKSVEKELIFVGLVAMIDQPRTEAKNAIGVCRQAGMRVVMITGDQPITAKAIARELGLDTSNVITGEQLDKIGDQELSHLASSTHVYAGVSPQHKLRIVSALKSMGEVVAVTGDGVNDAPALKRADIGVAMGITGTDVSKEASDMVLTDDNFATIVNAVHEGRRIYDNIRKSVYYLLSGNVGEIFAILIGALAGLPVPLVPIQILWVNLLTDGFPAIAMSIDPAAEGIMKRRPRDPNINILDAKYFSNVLAVGLIVGMVVLAAFFLDYDGTNLGHARTMAFTALVLIEIALAFSLHTRKLFFLDLLSNKYLFLAAAGSLLLQLAAVHLAVLQPIFHTTDITLNEWLLLGGAALVVLAFTELKKVITGHGVISQDV
ncbi:ATPase [Candidatus Micrarchaeota archaeon]|nr:MAG: ATPase [Candidatus Micrarchaeota archaeon]